jgi:protein-L-isoaspartate(D-aspartate) O-methyltransferase
MKLPEDSFRHKGLRKKLIEQISQKGSINKQVLQAIEKLPRHWFLDAAFLEYAYQDRPFPIDCDQTISQPFTVAFQTQLLDIQPLDRVLEIGTGSGYQTCILIEMGARVFSIERQKKLYTKALDFLPSIGYFARLFYGDGYKGLPAYAPFDKILITAGAPFIPQPLIDQLKPGGRMVVPVGEGAKQIMTLVSKTSETQYTTQDHGVFSFVPLLENKAGD